MNRGPDDSGQSTPQVYETSLGKQVIFRTFDAHAKAGRINLNIYL